MHTFMRRTSQFLENISVVFLLLLFVCVFVQIIMRNIFNTGSVEMEELARFSLISLVFLMIPALFANKQHIFVDLLLSHLTESVRRVFEIIIPGFTLGLSIVFLFSIKQILVRNWSVRTPALRMPNIVLYIPIVVGLLFMTIYTFVFLKDAIWVRENIE